MLTYQQRIAAFKSRHGIGRSHFTSGGFRKRGYAAASFDRLTADWMPATSTGDSEIRYDIQSLRDRSRDLERKDGTMRRFLNCLEKNVLKSGVGFNLQNKAKRPDGTPDAVINEAVEDGFSEWSKKKNCTENGEESLAEVYRLTLRCAARDGGAMIRKIRNPNINKFGFALRMIEIDHLDINYNTILSNGNRVVMGVEKNEVGRTLAYHLLMKHPGDHLFGSSPYNRYRVDASDIIHYFVKERITQCVGVPWAAPSMLRMHHLEQYEISEMIASRRAANKGGYFTSATGQPYAGEKEETTAGDGSTIETGTLDDSEPGQYDELPPGMTFTPYDPRHPTSQFGDFMRHARLGIAAGMDVSYATLIGDLKEANFSSMRTGWLDERETYKRMQSHLVEHLANEIFEAWLEMAITTGAVRLPMSRFEQFNKPTFHGRKWPWIDPQTDITANLMAVNGGLTTRETIINESDSEHDLEETYDQLAYEQELAKEKGLTFTDPTVKGATQQVMTQPEPAAPSAPNPAMNGKGGDRHLPLNSR